MEKDLRKFMSEMYEKYGLNEITIALSKLVDKYDTEKQRERLECLNMKSEQQ